MNHLVLLELTEFGFDAKGPNVEVVLGNPDQGCASGACEEQPSVHNYDTYCFSKDRTNLLPNEVWLTLQAKNDEPQVAFINALGWYCLAGKSPSLKNILQKAFHPQVT